MHIRSWKLATIDLEESGLSSADVIQTVTLKEYGNQTWQRTTDVGGAITAEKGSKLQFLLVSQTPRGKQSIQIQENVSTRDGNIEKAFIVVAKSLKGRSLKSKHVSTTQGF